MLADGGHGAGDGPLLGKGDYVIALITGLTPNGGSLLGRALAKTTLTTHSADASRLERELELEARREEMTMTEQQLKTADGGGL